MAMRIQIGPPGTLGASAHGVAGASPTPEIKRAMTFSQQHQAEHPEQPVDHIIKGDSQLMRRIRAMEDLAPDSPALRRFINLISVFVDLFKLAMASMLGVFVPQSCPGNETAWGGPDNCTDIIGPHDCSFQENFRCLVPFNKWVLAINFICLITLGLHYSLVWTRETFMVANFKESLAVGRLHLRTELPDYPTAALRLRRYNVWVFNVSLLVIILQLVNVVSSAYLCFILYPNGYKTFTTFVTNMLLLTIVLYNCISAAYVGIKHELAYSAIGFEPVSYNSLRPHNIKGQ